MPILEIGHLSLWRTDLAYYWVINCEPGLQDDMHYHENDDHIFMCLEGECTVRTPHKAFVLETARYRPAASPASLISSAIPARAECCCLAPATPCERQPAHPRAQDPQPHAAQRTDRCVIGLSTR